jgi:hypothetical protein
VKITRSVKDRTVDIGTASNSASGASGAKLPYHIDDYETILFKIGELFGLRLKRKQRNLILWPKMTERRYRSSLKQREFYASADINQ